MVTKKTSTKKSTTKSASKPIENEKICVILQYFFPIGAIWFFVDEKMKQSSLAKFHLKQSLVLVVLSIAIMILSFIVPFFVLVGWIFNLAILVLWILGLINAVNGVEKELPVVGKFASKFGF